jgi:2,3-dihydroxyphenylpropionate 1,2-dioxygenase
MGEIVAAMAMSHAPGLLSLPHAVPASQKREMDAGWETAKRQLDKAQPDVIIALINDHFENFFGKLMPTFAVGTAEENVGPPEHYVEWLNIERSAVPGAVEYARDLLATCIEREFDMAHVDAPYEFGHNLMAPLTYVRPELDIPVVPVITNVFTPPLPPPARSYHLGTAIRAAIEQRPERVAVIATGALSHFAPVWYRGKNDDDPLMRRLARLQTEGFSAIRDDPNLMIDVGRREEEMAERERGIIRPDWDRAVLSAFERGDREFLEGLTSEEIERSGGNGGHEVRNWITLMGVVGAAPAEVLFYVEAAAWLTGMGLIAYDASVLSRDRQAQAA